MTVTYVGDLSTDLDKVRFHIDDTVENSGVKPGGGNYQDAEINALLTANSNDIDRTITMLFQQLAASWARYVDTQVGDRRESLSQVAKQYRNLAQKWQSGELSTGENAVYFSEISLGIDEESSDYSNP